MTEHTKTDGLPRIDALAPQVSASPPQGPGRDARVSAGKIE